MKQTQIIGHDVINLLQISMFDIIFWKQKYSMKVTFMLFRISHGEDPVYVQVARVLWPAQMLYRRSYLTSFSRPLVWTYSWLFASVKILLANRNTYHMFF